MRFNYRKQTVPCDFDGTLRTRPAESRDCKYERDGYYLDFGLVFFFVPTGRPRPMTPSFRKSLQRALPRLERERTSWRDWR